MADYLVRTINHKRGAKDTETYDHTTMKYYENSLMCHFGPVHSKKN